MAPKLLFVSALLLLLSTALVLAYEREDPEREAPELKQCKQQCQLQPHPTLQRQCERRCEEQQREKEERGRGGDDNQRELEEQLERCRQQCEEREPRWQQQQECLRQCAETYKEKKRQEGGGKNEKDPEERLRECLQECRQEERSRGRECEQRCEVQYRREKEKEGGHRIEQGREEEEQKKKHYIFGKESFVHRFKTEHGYVRYLKKFYELSDLLVGIGNYRIAVLALNPKGFLAPHHCDTEALLYVVRGRGGLSMVCSEGRVSHEVKEGDILWVPAGAIVYMVNKHDSEPFVVTKLLQPVAVPGDVQEYFPVGGDNVESYFSNLSDEVLEAAFNVPKEKLERILGQKRQIIRRASDEQIRAIGSRSSEGGGGGRWRGSEGPFNLLQKKPSHSTDRGQLYEAGGDDYQPLKQLDIQVSFANITRGSMLGPFFNSLATKIAVIVDGTGWVQMVCPHIPGRRQGRETEQEERQGERYQTVTSDVAPGHVIVAPPGHPTVEIASAGTNLQALCFEIRADGNQRNFLAGKNNVWLHMEDEAKELTFGLSKKEVDEVLKAQKDEKIVPVHRERGRRQPLSSIMDFLDF